MLRLASTARCITSYELRQLDKMEQGDIRVAAFLRIGDGPPALHSIINYETMITYTAGLVSPRYRLIGTSID